LPERKREINNRLSQLRARVEHPFRVIKRRFGCAKVRYRGLAKNTAAEHFVRPVQSVFGATAVGAGPRLNVPGAKKTATERPNHALRLDKNQGMRGPKRS